MKVGDTVKVRRVNRYPSLDSGFEYYYGAIGNLEAVKIFTDGTEYYLVRFNSTINGLSYLYCSEVDSAYYNQVHLPKELFEI